MYFLYEHQKYNICIMSAIRPVFTARKLLKGMHNMCIEQKAESGEIDAN